MKRTFRSLLAAAGLAFIGLGSLLTATPAAAAPLQTVTQGGVTCSQYATNYGKYPYTIWNCVHPSAPTTLETNMGSIVRNIPAGPIPTFLTNNNSANLNSHVQLYIFTNKTAYANYFSVAAPAVNALGANKTQNVAAAFSTATINGVAADLTSYYNGHLLQQIGRIWSTQNGNQANSAVHSAAYRMDRDWLLLQGATPHDASVATWGATIANQFPTSGPTSILNQLYGGADPDMYAYQFERLIPGSHVVVNLETFLNNNLRKGSYGYVKNYGIGPLLNQADLQNGILCVEYSTNYGVSQFPQKVWECNKPWWANATDTGFAGNARNLHQNHQNLLTNNAVKLYNMRTIDDFILFDSLGATDRYGVAGFADKFVKKTGIFLSIINQGPPESTTPYTAYWSGTTVHELGYQLDKIWGDWSQSNGTNWRTALSADIAAFNTGTCANKVDADRLASGLTAICPLYPGIPWFEVLGKRLQNNDFEMWANAFSTAQATATNPPYVVRVFNRFPLIKQYMRNLHTSGGTPN